MKMILIEINETTLEKLSKDEYIVFADMDGMGADLKVLYGQRSQLIKDLGAINSKISKAWESRSS